MRSLCSHQIIWPLSAKLNGQTSQPNQPACKQLQLFFRSRLTITCLKSASRHFDVDNPIIATQIRRQREDKARRKESHSPACTRTTREHHAVSPYTLGDISCPKCAGECSRRTWIFFCSWSGKSERTAEIHHFSHCRLGRLSGMVHCPSCQHLGRATESRIHAGEKVQFQGHGGRIRPHFPLRWTRRRSAATSLLCIL